MRPEAVYQFSSLDFVDNTFVFIDEIDLSRIYRAGRLRPTLVDQNIPAAGQQIDAEAQAAAAPENFKPRSGAIPRNGKSRRRRKRKPGRHRQRAHQRLVALQMTVPSASASATGACLVSRNESFFA